MLEYTFYFNFYIVQLTYIKLIGKFHCSFMKFQGKQWFLRLSGCKSRNWQRNAQKGINDLMSRLRIFCSITNIYPLLVKVTIFRSLSRKGSLFGSTCTPVNLWHGTLILTVILKGKSKLVTSYNKHRDSINIFLPTFIMLFFQRVTILTYACFYI